MERVPVTFMLPASHAAAITMAAACASRLDAWGRIVLDHLVLVPPPEGAPESGKTPSKTPSQMLLEAHFNGA